MAMILAYAMQYPLCREILSAYQYTTTPTEKHPEGVLLTSTMFSRVYGDEPEGATIVAGKTGYTHQAHHCLASYGQRDRDGAGFILVTVDASGKFEPIFDAIHVYSEYIHK
jgi:D-alanyl-D-alanine carboxypeptidase (penicillin-binding protein 5/6)